jgi:hypothetical protein
VGEAAALIEHHGQGDRPRPELHRRRVDRRTFAATAGSRRKGQVHRPPMRTPKTQMIGRWRVAIATRHTAPLQPGQRGGNGAPCVSSPYEGAQLWARRPYAAPALRPADAAARGACPVRPRRLAIDGAGSSSSFSLSFSRRRRCRSVPERRRILAQTLDCPALLV